MKKLKPLRSCWICGNPANSGEHTSKRTDIKSVFGEISQVNPLFLNSSQFKNKRIQSLDSNFLKAKNSICSGCNNDVTSPYDRAWEKLSNWLTNEIDTLQVGYPLATQKNCPLTTNSEGAKLHNYFTKLFGVNIDRGNVPIDLQVFGTALRTGKPLSRVVLKIGPSLNNAEPEYVGMTDIHVKINRVTGRAVFANWFYTVGKLSVLLLYAEDKKYSDTLGQFQGAWHPRHGITKLVLADFRKLKDLTK
jgi:hypothetical protein